MANHPSAEKRNRQRIKRTDRNRSIKTAVRTIVKQVRAAIGSGDTVKAAAVLRAATSALDGAVTKGVLHRRTASRKISRLATAVRKIVTPAV